MDRYDLLFLCNLCRFCTSNPFECARNGVYEACGNIKIWNKLVEYIESLEDDSGIIELKNKILDETTTFCEECSSRENCPEDECVLYRIEQIIEKE